MSRKKSPPVAAPKWSAGKERVLVEERQSPKTAGLRTHGKQHHRGI